MTPGEEYRKFESNSCARRSIDTAARISSFPCETRDPPWEDFTIGMPGAKQPDQAPWHRSADPPRPRMSIENGQRSEGPYTIASSARKPGPSVRRGISGVPAPGTDLSTC
jgi:hypothetical protein